ncbi:MAG: sulfite exporter TauE/SafE family protein, partial [Candidatus Tectomicrobia bacterium]|nr:sulfite exporter TauE/SafE family protein [Candidatus Tectomicrobia bacterium]
MNIYAWLLLPLGFVSGTVNSLLGLGWGVVNIPMLMLVPGFTIRDAVALSVVTAIFMSAAATFENARHGLIQWNYVLL